MQQGGVADGVKLLLSFQVCSPESQHAITHCRVCVYS